MWLLTAAAAKDTKTYIQQHNERRAASEKTIGQEFVIALIFQIYTQLYSYWSNK